MHIKMVSLPVDDPIKAFKFYTEIVGLKEHTYMPDMQLAIVTSEDCKTTMLLEPKGDGYYDRFQKKVFKEGYPIIILGADDVRAEYERLKNLGINFKQEPTKKTWVKEVPLMDTLGN